MRSTIEQHYLRLLTPPEEATNTREGRSTRGGDESKQKTTTNATKVEFFCGKGCDTQRAAPVSAPPAWPSQQPPIRKRKDLATTKTMARTRTGQKKDKQTGKKNKAEHQRTNKGPSKNKNHTKSSSQKVMVAQLKALKS